MTPLVAVVAFYHKPSIPRFLQRKYSLPDAKISSSTTGFSLYCMSQAGEVLSLHRFITSRFKTMMTFLSFTLNKKDENFLHNDTWSPPRWTQFFTQTHLGCALHLLPHKIYVLKASSHPSKYGYISQPVHLVRACMELSEPY